MPLPRETTAFHHLGANCLCTPWRARINTWKARIKSGAARTISHPIDGERRGEIWFIFAGLRFRRPSRAVLAPSGHKTPLFSSWSCNCSAESRTQRQRHLSYAQSLRIASSGSITPRLSALSPISDLDRVLAFRVRPTLLLPQSWIPQAQTEHDQRHTQAKSRNTK